MSRYVSSSPPAPLNEVTDRLRSHFDSLLHIQANRREHAGSREELRLATDELRRWRERVQRDHKA